MAPPSTDVQDRFAGEVAEKGVLRLQVREGLPSGKAGSIDVRPQTNSDVAAPVRQNDSGTRIERGSGVLENNVV